MAFPETENRKGRCEMNAEKPICGTTDGWTDSPNNWSIIFAGDLVNKTDLIAIGNTRYPPNKFHRWMQEFFLGIRWRQIKDWTL